MRCGACALRSFPRSHGLAVVRAGSTLLACGCRGNRWRTRVHLTAMRIFSISRRRDAEHAAVFPAELRRALVAHPIARAADIEPIDPHQPASLLQAQALLILQWRHRGN